MREETDDQALARLEDELRSSRFKAWDVEEFLARRHQAKIEALRPEPGAKGAPRIQVAKELAALALMAIGYLTVITVPALWLITGESPRAWIAHDEQFHLLRDNPIPPPR